MVTQNPLTRLQQNRNFLSPVGFRFILNKYPKVDFFSNSAILPGVNLGVAVQPSYLKMIDHPGDILQYDNFQLNFLVDEDMENYIAMYEWLSGLGYPKDIGQYQELYNGDEPRPPSDLKNIYSQGTLQILNSNYQINKQIIFKDLFPISLQPLAFESTDRDYNYFTAQATFKYTIFNIADKRGKVIV